MADIVDGDRSLVVTGDVDVVELLERPAFARVGRAVVVDAHGMPVGLVSITDVKRAIRGARLTAHAPSGAVG